MIFDEALFLKTPFIINDNKIPEIKQVLSQGLPHSYRINDNKIIDSLRPLERPETKEWRKENQRNFTHEVISNLITESLAVIKPLGINYTAKNDDLDYLINDKKFKFITEEIGFSELLYDCIYPMSIADPNLKVIIFPYIAENKEIPPNLKSDKTKQISADIKIVPSELIKTIPNTDLFVFTGGKKKYKLDGIAEKEEYFYWLYDDKSIYKIEPLSYKDGKIIYKFELWYEMGFKAVYTAIGVTSKTKEGIIYQESIAREAYPHLDEAMGVKSDHQFSLTRSTYQTLVMPELSCGECGGQGSILAEEGGQIISKQCKSCKGTMKQSNPGIADKLIIPSAQYEGDRGAGNAKPYYLSPDISGVQYIGNYAYDCIERGALSLGLNSLVKTSESGEAMKMRLTKWENKVNVIYDKLITLIENLLNGYAKTLNIDGTINVIREQRIGIKTPELLLKNFQDSLPIEKTNAALNYLESKYGNDAKLMKIFKYVIYKYPITCMDAAQIQYYVALNIYTNDDIKKAHQIMPFLLTIKEELDEITEDVLDKAIDGRFNKEI